MFGFYEMTMRTRAWLVRNVQDRCSYSVVTRPFVASDEHVLQMS